MPVSLVIVFFELVTIALCVHSYAVFLNLDKVLTNNCSLLTFSNNFFLLSFLMSIIRNFEFLISSDRTGRDGDA